MEELQTISKTVNQLPIHEVANVDQVTLYHVKHETNSSINEIEFQKTDAIDTQGGEKVKMASHDSIPANPAGKTSEIGQEAEIVLNLKKANEQTNTSKLSILRKNLSEPTLSRNYRRKDVSCTNPVAGASLLDNSVKHRQSFADVVTEMINEPIKEDLHPFGRGHLYRSAIYGEYQTKTFRSDEKLLLWAVATLLILGIACGIILMSIMYQRSELIYAHESGMDHTNRTNMTFKNQE